MNPVEPQVHEGAKLVPFAKDQPQYIPLPASVDPNGLVMTEWVPTDEEMAQLILGGRVRIWTHTFNKPLQPMKVEIVEPPCGYFDVKES